MFPHKTSKAPDAKTGATTSETPQQSAGRYTPYDEGDVREKLGFDRNDENVTVKFMPLGGHDDMGLADIADVIRDIENTLGIGPRLTNGDEPTRDPNVTAGGNISATEQRMQDQIVPLLGSTTEVLAEVLKAMEKHPPMHSPHEGWAVIKEELDELWDEVKADRGRMLSARKEAIQTAATAIRYLVDIDPR